MKFWAEIIGGLALPPSIAWGYAALLRFSFITSWIGSAVGGVIAGVMGSGVTWGTVNGVSLAMAVAVWWYRRRKRKDPAARQFGAKSRARIAALVERAREAAKPGPVLRPVPGGAR